MVEKVINIGGVPVKMACSADTLRKYRIAFGRDLLHDVQELNIENLNVECLEDIAYIMAKQGDPEMALSIDEWLDQFNLLDVIEASAEVVNMWKWNMLSTSKAKKK